MEQRSIAFVGLEEQTISACMSMIGIMHNMASVDWRQSDPQDADLLMISADQAIPASEQPYIIIYRNGEPKPAGRYSLSLPFRAMRLMNLLEEIITASDSPASRKPTVVQETAKPGMPPSAQAKQNNDAFNYKLWQQIADLMVVDAEAGYYRAQTNAGRIYLEPHHRVFFADEKQLQLLEASSLQLLHLDKKIAEIPSNLLQRPVFLLPWYAQGSEDNLLLWLRGEVRFKLLRWPHLGFFPRSRERLTLCALLSKQAFTFEQLGGMTAASDQALTRFLNACAVNGLLEVTPAKPLAKQPSMAASGEAKTGRFSNMIKSLRSRLGLNA